MSEETYENIYKNPKFKELTRKRSRFAWILSLMILVVYYSFVLVVGFAPEWLATPLQEGMTTTVGVPVGVAIIVFAWILTGVYIRRANKDFDRMNDEILDGFRLHADRSGLSL